MSDSKYRLVVQVEVFQTVRSGQILILMVLVLGVSLSGSAQELGIGVPMQLKGAKTYYISARVSGMEPSEFMVDTGSSYTTINEYTLDRLLAHGGAEYLRDLTAVLANGAELRVPLYRIAGIQLGSQCQLTRLEVAVFPGRTRQILGLSTLRKASPFLFSVDPPQLRLSNCNNQLSLAED